MVDRIPSPRLERIPEDADVRRVLLTLSCTDADAIPKVENAGELFETGGVAVQRMFNGLLIEEGCYGGPWTTEIIRSLHGHHEPQEEVAFDAIVRRLQSDQSTNPRMIEFGSFWSFYSMWFGKSLPAARVLDLEPDPNHLEVGRRNVALNGLNDRIEFLHGAIGDRPGEELVFQNESDLDTISVTQYDLGSLLARQKWDHVDLVLVDVQGAETVLLERARADFMAGRVRFAVVSTHHHIISGDPLTHQKALTLILECGGHIIAEHSVQESFSGDGLIVASFDERDRDLVVRVSYSRSKDSFFGELEWNLASATASIASWRERVDVAESEMSRMRDTRLWRAAAPLRRAYSALRQTSSR